MTAKVGNTVTQAFFRGRLGCRKTSSFYGGDSLKVVESCRSDIHAIAPSVTARLPLTVGHGERIFQILYRKRREKATGKRLETARKMNVPKVPDLHIALFQR